jgi:ribosomal protein S12 methylthiotransferase
MIIYLETLGCCRNQVDSEVMLGRLASRAHDITSDPSGAEVIIVNTCGFIATASAEAIDTILDMAQYKKEGSCRRLVVTGCLPERFREDTLVDSLPEVDAFLGTGACDRIVDAVEDMSGTVITLLPDPCARELQGLPLPRKITQDYTAYVKVSEGCNRKCTYCIIPTLRGIQRSRPVDSVVEETASLISQGVNEIILVGENTTDYGLDFNPPVPLSHLLGAVSTRVAGIQKPQPTWIRLLYTHPSSIDRSVIEAIAENENICSYYDIPIQHADSRTLRRMGRNYTRENLYSLFETIRTIDPKAVLRTTLITGFPGETESEFQTLVKFVEDIRFDHLGVFPYSDSEDLASYHLKNHVPEILREERHDTIMARQAQISDAINQKYLGQTIPVLVEENPDEGIYLGRTGFQAPEVDGITFIYGSGLEIGTFTDVKITETHEYDLAGETA